MARALYALVLGISAAISVAALSGWFLTRRALQPLVQMAETARRIGEGPDLGPRVAYEGPQDEVGKLASTFNHMLDRIHRAFESQRHFIADSSHELRTPLTVIRGNLDLLKRNLNPGAQGEALAAIEREAARMSKIVSDLLLLAQIESPGALEHHPVSLNSLLLEAYERAQPMAGGRHVLLGRQDTVTVMGDADKLRQLITNLVDNAIRYTPEGGSIHLSLRGDGPWARLEVADTGVGIPPEHLPHVFDRFYRADKARSRAQGGTGLGLAIVKGIAEAHGGRVTVTSQPGEGSTFTVWLKV